MTQNTYGYSILSSNVILKILASELTSLTKFILGIFGWCFESQKGARGHLNDPWEL